MLYSFGFVYSHAQYPDCTVDVAPQNDYDEYHINVQYDRFLSGMKSEHDNGREDRKFSWRYCKHYCDRVTTSWVLPITNYDEQWQRDCTGQNNGKAGLIGAISYHSDSKEDRRWTFYCGELKSGYETYDCGWTNYVNGWDQDVNYDCPKDGIMRGISSYHDNGKEDRRWRFECCKVRQTGSSPAEMNSEEADGNNHAIMTPESQNRILIIIVSISTGLCILCLISGLCLYKRRKRVGSIYEHTVKAQDEDMDIDENIEIGTSVDGDIDGNVCNLDLEKEELKVIGE